MLSGLGVLVRSSKPRSRRKCPLTDGSIKLGASARPLNGLHSWHGWLVQQQIPEHILKLKHMPLHLTAWPCSTRAKTWQQLWPNIKGQSETLPSHKPSMLTDIASRRDCQLMQILYACPACLRSVQDASLILLLADNSMALSARL